MYNNINYIDKLIWNKTALEQGQQLCSVRGQQPKNKKNIILGSHRAIK